MPTSSIHDEAPAEVVRVLRQWENQRIRLASKRLQSRASAGEAKFFSDKEGNGGEVTMRVDKLSYHYWGQRLGYQCWDDPQFCREYKRDNPSCRVRSRSNKIQVSLTQTGNRGIQPVTSVNNVRSRTAYATN